jgi:hypothetical protein
MSNEALQNEITGLLRSEDKADREALQWLVLKHAQKERLNVDDYIETIAATIAERRLEIGGEQTKQTEQTRRPELSTRDFLEGYLAQKEWELNEQLERERHTTPSAQSDLQQEVGPPSQEIFSQLEAFTRWSEIPGNAFDRDVMQSIKEVAELKLCTTTPQTLQDQDKVVWEPKEHVHPKADSWRRDASGRLYVVPSTFGKTFSNNAGTHPIDEAVGTLWAAMKNFDEAITRRTLRSESEVVHHTSQVFTAFKALKLMTDLYNNSIWPPMEGLRRSLNNQLGRFQKLSDQLSQAQPRLLDLPETTAAMLERVPTEGRDGRTRRSRPMAEGPQSNGQVPDRRSESLSRGPHW